MLSDHSVDPARTTPRWQEYERVVGERLALAPERRAALLEWASRQRAVIIEDDYDAEYRYDREPIGALQRLAPIAWYMSVLPAKYCRSALRLGWLVVPPGFVSDIARAKLQADNGSATPEQLALAEFIDTGAFDSHLRRTRHVSTSS